ncbi:ABC transporter substrate-binding protein [Streptomyces sp. N35]|uniref:ABC transporter substrate-binding protein n=1 Tax=Streptomyces sp. N35 TaxID=2795730 RepID=UPI0018F3DEB2|nr:ABC transporter substrate-binding protein [Streptomyces sp. N35]
MSAKNRPSHLNKGGLSRRGLLSAGAAFGLGAFLTACGDDKKPAASTDKGKDKPWSFKDDRGKTAKVGHTPNKIVAFVSTAAALHDYGIECVGIFGPSKPVDGKPNPQAGAMDVSKVTSLGEDWGQFNVEKYAALEPDLLISNMFPAPLLWFVPEESTKKIEALAPTVGIDGARRTLLDPLKRYTDLAESLGADLEAKAVKDAKARFDKAEARLREAAKQNKGLKVMAVTADKDQFYVAVPDSYCDLNYFKDLGVEIVEGKKVDEWGFWEKFSWENTEKYHADLILLDNRSQTLPAAELAKKPTWTRLPAIEADQVIPWSMEERYSYAGYAPVLEALAEAIENAKKLKA